MPRIWPFRHIGLKVLSVALALLLWMVVSGEETVERGLRVPLELQQVPADLEQTGDTPDTVDVRVRGTSSALSRLGAGEVVAVLDLHSASTGRRLFPLTPDQVRAPFGVEVLQVMPSTVAMVFETSASRHIPVAPAVEGKPAPGYVVGAMTADPPSAEVIGPEGAVKRATEVLAGPVSVADARDRVQETVMLGLLDPSLRLTTIRSTRVTVQILPAPLERTLRGRPVHLRGLAATLDAEAVPAMVTVGLRGSREALGRTADDEVVAYIDLAGLGAGQYALTVHVEGARDAGITHIDPPSVQVRVTSAKR
jgi:YbbR domain-containing protein